MLADGSPVPCILLANKCDAIDAEEMEKKKAMLGPAENCLDRLILCKTNNVYTSLTLMMEVPIG